MAWWVVVVVAPCPHRLLNACITSSCVAAAGFVLFAAVAADPDVWLCVDSVELADASLLARARLTGCWGGRCA